MTEKSLMTASAVRSSWTTFWFAQEASGRLLRPIRIGIALLCACYFASHWADIGWWFSQSGALSPEAVRVFLIDADLGDSAGWRLSPLYWVDSPLFLRAYLLAGIGLSLAWGWWTRNRWLGTGVWLAVVGLANRSFLIAGLEELLLAWSVAYLAMAPADGADHWSGSLALRAIQVHLTMLIGVTGLTMLSSLAWWDGTGVMALVAPTEDRYIDWGRILSAAWAQELVSLMIVWGAIAGPILLWIKATRTLGWIGLTAWALGLAMLTSQLITFVGIAVLLLAFRSRLDHRAEIVRSEPQTNR